MKIGSWETSFSRWAEVFPKRLVPQALELIKRWALVFSREETWVYRTYEVPSLIIRLDCVERDGVLQLYEIEERPAGIGIASYINSDFRRRLAEVRQKWPPIAVVVSPRREEGGDDFLWAPVKALEDIPEDFWLLIRAEPWEEEFWPLAARSISTVRYKGWKGYGEKLGLWRRVSSENELPWEEGFVLKPLQGSKCQDIEIFAPHSSVQGNSTRTRIIRRLKEKGLMYLQPLIPPMKWEERVPEEIRQYYGRIWRFFFGFNPSQGWTPLGGVWNARRNWRVHGASDALFGLLVLDE